MITYEHRGCHRLIAVYYGPMDRGSPIMASRMWRIRDKDGRFTTPTLGSLDRAVCPQCGARVIAAAHTFVERARR